MKIEHSAGKAPVLDDDTYDIVIRSCTPIDLETPDEFGKTKKFSMKVEIVGQLDEDGEQIYLDPRPNRILSDGGKSGNASTLFKICNACGIETENGLESDDLIDATCRAVIKTEKPGAWPKITDWLKSKGTAQRAPVRAQEARQRPQASSAEDAQPPADFEPCEHEPRTNPQGVTFCMKCGDILG